LTPGHLFIYKDTIFLHFIKVMFVLALPVEHRKGWCSGTGPKRLRIIDSLRNYIVYPAKDDTPFSCHITKEEIS
jgi:hypothetical protein